MSIDQGRRIDLMNDTRLNVATLLREPLGSSREIRFTLDALPLDRDLAAREIEGTARLTRLRDAVLVAAKARGVARLECARCLSAYDQPFAADFAEEFRQTVDVHTGHDLDRDRETAVDEEDDEPGFSIDENHELDLAEALRQWVVLELPMRPDCGALCAGPEVTRFGDEDAVDSRLAALAELLPEEDRSRA
jgi:uncharacterized protein